MLCAACWPKVTLGVIILSCPPGSVVVVDNCGVTSMNDSLGKGCKLEDKGISMGAWGKIALGVIDPVPVGVKLPVVLVGLEVVESTLSVGLAGAGTLPIASGPGGEMEGIDVDITSEGVGAGISKVEYETSNLA